MDEIVFQVETLEVKKRRKIELKKVFSAIIGWPSLEIEHTEAARAIKIFIFYGHLLLVYQNRNDIASKPSKWFTFLTISVDVCVLLTITRLIVSYFVNDSAILVCLGDVFTGWSNGYPIGILCIIGTICLEAFRFFSCYQARNGSLVWFRVIEEAVIHGFTNEILNMQTIQSKQFRQQIVFLSRQIIGASIIPTTIWISVYIYLLFNSPLTYSSIQSPLYFICFTFWQLLSILTIIFIVPQVAWFSIMIIMSICYLNNRISSVYCELKISSNAKLKRFHALYHKQVEVLNEMDHINNLLRHVFFVGYYAIGFSGEVAILYSYLNLFKIPITDRGLAIAGSNAVFQIGLASYLAAKILVKLLELLNRLNCPDNGLWIGDSFIMDNLSFVQVLLDNPSMNYLTESIGQSDLEIGLQLSKSLATNRDSNATPLNANLVNGDSDADSGIVAIGPTRIGSASSTDTDPDVTLTSAYGNKSSSISSSSSSNRDSTNPTPIPISLHQDKRKPIFQRVRFDDQSPPTHLALRKSLSQLSTSMYSPKGSTTIDQLTSEPKMRLNSSTNQNQSTVLPKETHPLAHRRLTIPSPLPLKSSLTTSLSSTPSPSSSSSTSSSSVTTISKPIDRSWSTLPRNNKIGTNSNAKWTSTLNQKNRNNFQSTLPNGTRKSFLDNKKPDLIESHSVKLSLSSSFRSSPDPAKQSKLSTLPNGFKTQKPSSSAPTPPTLTNSTNKTSTDSTSCISKSRSCSTLNNHSKDKLNSNTTGSNEPKITKLCTIDPLESTDSMVCAFASVANVVSDDASSIVNDKVSVDKAVAAAVAAVNFVTNNQVNSSSPATKSVNRPSHSMTPINNNANGHLYSNQSLEYSPQFNSNQHFQRINSSQNSKKIEFHEMEDDIKEHDNLDHQYEAIFPCGKTSTSNEPESGLTATSSSTAPLLPMESLVQSKALIGNSVERKSNQLSVNSNESEPSNGQRSIQSQDSNIAQQHFPQYQPHHSHSQHHHHHHFHHNNLEKAHANSNINDETVNPISAGIHYRSILKRSSTSSPNWPSTHFGEEDCKVRKQVEDSVNDEGMKDNQRKLDLADNNEQYLGEGKEEEDVPKEDEEVERKEEKQGKEKDEDKFVQKQDKTMPMALQINGPYFISSSASPSTHLISSSSCQSMNQQNQQLKQTNILPKMMTTYLSSTGVLSTKKSMDDPCEATYLQPDQIYPLPASKSKPTLTSTSVTMLHKIKDEEQKNESHETCQVEYATISKSVTKKQDSHEAHRPNLLNHSYLHHSTHHSTFPQPSSTPIHNKINEQTRSMIEGKPLPSPGNNSILKVTRFALDVPDGINIHANCTAQPVATTVQGSSNKWLSKRIGGLRKALSRAFSTDKLPKDHLSNNQSTVNSSLLASSLTASANLKSSLAVASVNHISSSKSTPNLNSKLESNDSLQKNHSTEDLSIDLKSFVKTVKNRMSFRKAKGKSKSIDKDNSINQIEKQDESKTKWNNVNAKENYNQESNQLWGELIELKADGSQVIELNRPQSKPFGFFLARGTVNNVKGVFVSRMRDEQTQTILTGLLEIGDEIVAIDGLDVKSYNIAQVNQLMSIKKKIKLTVRPYINQNH